MYYTVNTLLIFFLLRVGGVPSGLRIISNRNINENEYPYIVRLERQIILLEVSKVEAEDDVYICTCAALSPTLTLTAGHCIDSTSPSKYLTDNVQVKCVVRYGPAGNETADVTSTVRHPSYKKGVYNLQNDIGLLRTNPIKLKVFGKISPMDFNLLGGQEITFVGYEHLDSSLPSALRQKLSNPMKIMKASIVRSDKRNVSTVPEVCVIRRCVPAPAEVCPEAAGSPMLHPTGIVGVNTLSMGNLLYCSTQSKNKLIDIGIITPVTPYTDWIHFNIISESFDIIS